MQYNRRLGILCTSIPLIFYLVSIIFYKVKFPYFISQSINFSLLIILSCFVEKVYLRMPISQESIFRFTAAWTILFPLAAIISDLLRFYLLDQIPSFLPQIHLYIVFLLICGFSYGIFFTFCYRTFYYFLYLRGKKAGK